MDSFPLIVNENFMINPSFVGHKGGRGDKSAKEGERTGNQGYKKIGKWPIN